MLQALSEGVWVPLFFWASQTCYSSDLKCLRDHMPQAWQQLVALVTMVETLGGTVLVGRSRSSGKGPCTVSLDPASLSLYFLIPFPYLSPSPCLHFRPSSPSFLHLPGLSHLSLPLAYQEMGNFFSTACSLSGCSPLSATSQAHSNANLRLKCLKVNPSFF